MIRRRDNWPALLEAHLREWDSKPFAYGDADCVSFAASWLSRLGYADPLAGLGKWGNAKEAARIYQALGGFAHAVAAQLHALGCERIEPAFASRGDLVLVPAGAKGRHVLAIANGRLAEAHADNGTVRMPIIPNATAAWRI